MILIILVINLSKEFRVSHLEDLKNTLCFAHGFFRLCKIHKFEKTSKASHQSIIMLIAIFFAMICWGWFQQSSIMFCQPLVWHIGRSAPTQLCNVQCTSINQTDTKFCHQQVNIVAWREVVAQLMSHSWKWFGAAMTLNATMLTANNHPPNSVFFFASPWWKKAMFNLAIHPKRWNAAPSGPPLCRDLCPLQSSCRRCAWALVNCFAKIENTLKRNHELAGWIVKVQQTQSKSAVAKQRFSWNKQKHQIVLPSSCSFCGSICVFQTLKHCFLFAPARTCLVHPHERSLKRFSQNPHWPNNALVETAKMPNFAPLQRMISSSTFSKTDQTHDSLCQSNWLSCALLAKTFFQRHETTATELELPLNASHLDFFVNMWRLALCDHRQAWDKASCKWVWFFSFDAAGWGHLRLQWWQGWSKQLRMSWATMVLMDDSRASRAFGLAGRSQIFFIVRSVADAREKHRTKIL